jgi:large subunit ribosomal protein L27
MLRLVCSSSSTLLAPTLMRSFVPLRTASKASATKTRNGRDSHPKYLGLKKGIGEYCRPCEILVRQRGTRYHPGQGVVMGRDFTLHAQVPGYLAIETRRLCRSVKRGWKVRKFLHIVPTKPLAPIQDIR